MLNFHEIWEHLKVPSVTEKLRAVGDILQYALPWLALIFSILGVPHQAPAAVAHVMVVYWILAMLASVLTTAALKKVFNYTKWGARPDGRLNSFPSGHATAAFAAFWFLLILWGGSFVVLLFLIGAVVTAVSRVLAKRCHTKDVITGAVISAVTVVIVLSSTTVSQFVISLLS